MAKLTVKLKCKFKAGPALIYDKKINDFIPLGKDALQDLLATADQDAFALDVVFLEINDGYPDVGFKLKKRNLKEGGLFEVTLDKKTGFLLVNVDGVLESSSAKPKDVSRVISYGDKADLRLQSLEYRDFTKDGFSAAIRGQKEGAYKSWFKLNTWKFN